MHFKASLYLQLIKLVVKNWRLSNHLRVACNKYDDVLLTICRQFVFVFHKLSKNCSNHPIAAMLFLYSNSGFTWLEEFTKLKDLNSTDAIKHAPRDFAESDSSGNNKHGAIRTFFWPLTEKGIPNYRGDQKMQSTAIMFWRFCLIGKIGWWLEQFRSVWGTKVWW